MDRYFGWNEIGSRKYASKKEGILNSNMVFDLLGLIHTLFVLADADRFLVQKDDLVSMLSWISICEACLDFSDTRFTTILTSVWTYFDDG